VRAVELLYATNNRDLVVPFVADLDRVGDIGVLTIVAEIAAKHDDARAMLYLGKDGIARGIAFDHYAFPGVGIPKFASIGGGADRSLVYAIARQESAFQPRVVSTARAMGLMQVTPGTGRVIAKKFGVKFDAKRLLNDPVYNVQMGAAEIGDLVHDYDGNHVLAFVGYNAGRGRVREWIARYGDPRDPNVDVVDWVERIPFSETRNYVQRVMENMQVYRARFGHGAGLRIEADMRGRK
jgi:soluble lytic murein transglycosylase